MWIEAVHHIADLWKRSPANQLYSPRTTQVAKDVLTAEQFRAVVALLKLPRNPMVRVAVACAFRPTELLALRWRDLDVIVKTFVIRQTVYRGEIRNFTKTTEADEMAITLLTVPIPDMRLQTLIDYRGPRNKRQLLANDALDPGL